jgi:hypothetical protein
MPKTLDETLNLKTPRGLKHKLQKVAQTRSKKFGVRVTASDVAREALTQFTERDKQA